MFGISKIFGRQGRDIADDSVEIYGADVSPINMSEVGAEGFTRLDRRYDSHPVVGKQKPAPKYPDRQR